MTPTLRSLLFPYLLSCALLLAQVVVGQASDPESISRTLNLDQAGGIVAYSGKPLPNGKKLIGCLDSNGYWIARQPPCRSKFKHVPLDGVGYALQSVDNGRYLTTNTAGSSLLTAAPSQSQLFTSVMIIMSDDYLVKFGRQEVFRARYAPDPRFKAALFPVPPADNNINAPMPKMPNYPITLHWRPDQGPTDIN
ncbi:MAG: hypothetical protein M1816_004832 [Peltula sp. TS41687]|nr:MAG: hypothetical protein M1816_004832 [Peltula sp. TS41687]